MSFYNFAIAVVKGFYRIAFRMKIEGIENMKVLFGMSNEDTVKNIVKYYEEKYEGNGVLFDINDYVYVFNSNENKTIDSEQYVSCTLPESGKKINTEFVAHTYAIFKEDGEKINIDLCNLRLDTDAVCAGLEDENTFMIDYANGGKRSDPKNFRESVIEISGFESQPTTLIGTGSNNAKGKAEWNEETKTLTLTVISNGEVRITVE